MAFTLIVGCFVAQQAQLVVPRWANEEDGIVKLDESGKKGDRSGLGRVESPKLPASRFVAKSHAHGSVGRDGVVIEMTVVLSSGDRFTVKTVDTGGPMAPLVGDFNRNIELPFVSDPNNPPKEITFEAVFHDTGQFEIDPFVIEPWPRWSLTWLAAGGYGAGLGVIFGLAAGVYGLLAAVPSSRVIAVQFGRVSIYAGVVIALTAIAFYFASYPFGIWMPTLVVGALSAIVFAGTAPLVRKGMEAAEIMRANPDPSREPA